jgi:hypothetical protein
METGMAILASLAFFSGLFPRGSSPEMLESKHFILPHPLALHLRLKIPEETNSHANRYHGTQIAAG